MKTLDFTASQLCVRPITFSERGDDFGANLHPAENTLTPHFHSIQIRPLVTITYLL
jgi:hypothetical protein